MINCTDCKYAEWYRTKNESLHPSGDGECKYLVKKPVLPVSKWFYDFTVRGGHINRKVELKTHCPCYQRRVK